MPAAASSWSTEEIRKLRTMVQAGASVRDLAANLRRSESAIRNKAAMHGIPLRGMPEATESR